MGSRLIPLTCIRPKVREFTLQTHYMNKLNFIMLKMVRWSGWPLLPLILLFLLTGYIMDGRYGLSRVLDEKSALTFHRMLHLPLIVLVLAHSVPAVYLAMQRWGWIRAAQSRERRNPKSEVRSPKEGRRPKSEGGRVAGLSRRAAIGLGAAGVAGHRRGGVAVGFLLQMAGGRGAGGHLQG